jgi:hypothetical protein
MDIVLPAISNFADLLNTQVCKKWNDIAMDNNPDVNCSVMYYDIYCILFYDKGIYDESSIRKGLIIAELRDNDTYEQKMIPELTMYEDDLDGGDPIVAVSDNYLPQEFRIFLSVYKEFPSNKIRLYSSTFMQKITSMQFDLTRNALLEGGRDDVCKLVHIHPLCYSKHYKNSVADTQFINILCYVNILGFDISPPDNNNFGEIDERYFIIVLEMDNLQDKEVHNKLLIEKITTITERVKSNIEYLEDLDLQTFMQAFKTVLKQQLFNM